MCVCVCVCVCVVQFLVNTVKNKCSHKFGHKIVGFYFLESIKILSPSHVSDKSGQEISYNLLFSFKISLGGEVLVGKIF